MAIDRLTYLVGQLAAAQNWNVPSEVVSMRAKQVHLLASDMLKTIQDKCEKHGDIRDPRNTNQECDSCGKIL